MVIYNTVFASEHLEEGIYTALLTPMHEDLSCNCEELASHAFDLLERGCKGVVLFGTTGEGPSFSVEERKSVLEEMISKGFDPQKILLANGSSGITDTVRLLKIGIENNIAAFLIAPPSFFKNISDEGVIAFYREIIQKTNDPRLRVILYHIPQYSGVAISLRVIEELVKEFEGIVIGIKESEGNLSFAKSVIDAFPGFQVFVGNEGHIIQAVNYGAAGSICGVANLYPELIVSLYDLGKKGNGKNPAEIENFFEALKGYHYIPAAKAIMAKRKGEGWNRIRPPLTPLDSFQKEAFLSKVEK